MKFNQTVFATACIVALAGCSVDASTPIIDAETPKEAAEAYIIGLCEGNADQVINQTYDKQAAALAGFDAALSAEQRLCEKYGGFSTMNTGWESSDGENMNVSIVFNDGTETGEFRYNTSQDGGYYKVRRGLPRMCHHKRGCFDETDAK